MKLVSIPISAITFFIPAYIFIWMVTSVLALTPQEQQLAQHAKEQLELSKKDGATASAETTAAKSEASQARQSATIADQKADVAVAQINADMKKYRGHWGLNAIGLGLKELFGHIIILAIFLILFCAGIWLLRSAITVAFPFAGPIFKVIEDFVSGLFKKK